MFSDLDGTRRELGGLMGVLVERRADSATVGASTILYHAPWKGDALLQGPFASGIV